MLEQAVQQRSIKISAGMYNLAEGTAAAEGRSVSDQVEFWARVGRAALDNPDLPVDFISDILTSKAQGRTLAEPFKPE